MDFLEGIGLFTRICEEKELDKRVSEEKTRFEAVCKEAHEKICDLRWAPLLSCKGPMVVDMSSREKCLEALADGCTTSKQVCERLHPQMSQCSKEDKRRWMKATSMLLLRLSDSKTRLAWVCRIGKTRTIHITADGVKRLAHSREERERIAKAEELRVRRDEIVNLNEQMVESTKRMRENTCEALKSLGDDQDPVRHIHSIYGGLVESQSRAIVMLQGALNAKNDAQRTDALDQSTSVLKDVGDFEALYSGILILAREERKPLKEKIRRLESETEQLKEKEQERREKQEKDRKKRKLFNALLAVHLYQQSQKSQQPRTIDRETESLPTQPPGVWTVWKKPPEPNTLAVKRE